MKLTERPFKEFKLSEIFEINYGVNLELNNCSECTKNENSSVNFVARTAENNGVSAHVYKIGDIPPQKRGLITVAAGGSVLSTFLQTEPFYSGRDLYTLESKKKISDEAKLFIVTIIKKNRYKNSYGRQANKTLPDLILKLPVTSHGDPDYDFMDRYIKSLRSKPLSTRNKPLVSELGKRVWADFLLSDYFDIFPGKYHYPEEYEIGETPYYSASNENNGIGSCINLKADFEGNCIITGKIGCTAFYAPEPFCATSDVNIFKPKFKMDAAVGIFVAGVINFSENYKWAYGRQCRVGNSKKIIVKLPSNDEGCPDWDFMRDYIRKLPYGDRLFIIGK